MLNPNAPEFVPRTSAKVVPRCAMPSMRAQPYFEWDYEAEDNITEQELEEIESTEEWVRTMAWLDSLEREHLICYALQYAPAKAIELEERAGLLKIPDAPSRKKSLKGKH